MSRTADHCGHRESDGIVVDLCWNCGELEDEFRIEVIVERPDGLRPPSLRGERSDRGSLSPVLGRPGGAQRQAMGGVVLEPLRLDPLARRWSRALEAARSALRAAGPYFESRELDEHRRLLVQERRHIARLLESLARELTSPLIEGKCS